MICFHTSNTSIRKHWSQRWIWLFLSRSCQLTIWTVMIMILFIKVEYNLKKQAMGITTQVLWNSPIMLSKFPKKEWSKIKKKKKKRCLEKTKANRVNWNKQNLYLIVFMKKWVVLWVSYAKDLKTDLNNSKIIITWI